MFHNQSSLSTFHLNSQSATVLPCAVQAICQLQAAILLAGTISACSAQSSTRARVSASSANGTDISFTGVGGTASVTVNVNNQTKTIGAASPADGTVMNTPDIDAVHGPPVMSVVETDPTISAPAPAMMTPPAPGPEGIFS